MPGVLRRMARGMLNGTKPGQHARPKNAVHKRRMFSRSRRWSGSRGAMRPHPAGHTLFLESTSLDIKLMTEYCQFPPA